MKRARFTDEKIVRILQEADRAPLSARAHLPSTVQETRSLANVNAGEVRALLL
jgi:hypothetical protein